MPEEDRLPTQLSLEPTSAQQRMRSLDRILFVGLIVAALTVVSYILLFFQTHAWQILAVAAGVAAGGACLFPARRRLKRNDLDGAGDWSLVAIVLAFGVGELFWLHNTLFATLGALLLFLLIGSLVRPRHWKIWLIVGVVYGVYIVAVNRFQPLPRYDIAQVQLLNAFIPIAVGVLVLTLIWLIARGYVNYSLRTKLVVAFLAISLVSVGGVALYAQNVIRSATQNQSSSELVNVGRLQGDSIGALLTKEVELLRSLGLDEAIRAQAATSNAGYQGSVTDIQASLLKRDGEWLAAVAAGDTTIPLIQSKLDNPIAAHLREYRATYPENVEVFVTDRYGALLAATNRTSDYYQADEGWWQAAYNNGQGSIYYAQPDFDESSQTYSIDIALPIYEQGGNNIVGILRTTLNLAAVVDLLSSTRIGQTGRADMLLPSNQFVQASSPISATADLLATLPTQAGRVAEVDWYGVPSFATLERVRSSDQELGTTIDRLGWQIVAHQSSAEILAPVEAQTGVVLLVLAFVVVVVIGASVGLSQILVRPIAHLTATAQQVAAGDLTAQAPVETSDEIGTLALTFNSMTTQLSTLVSSLEERVQARTEQLRTSAAVGQAVASVLDPNQLLREVVDLITERFGFYYAAVFTLDEAGRYAVLREGTGEAGRTLKERGHKLEVGGQSMVGSVTAQNKARIALDVGEEAVRFANPLLPETRSEIALPLAVGKRVWGALDVQSTQPAAFDEASAVALQSMADQIAIALNNAEQFKQIEQQARQQSNLSQFSRSLFAASTAEDLYRVLATALKSIVPHDYLSLAYTQSNSATVRAYTLQVEADPVLVEGPVWSMSNTLSGRACSTRQPAVSEQLEQDVALDDVMQWELMGFRSALSLPLIFGERVLGTLNFASQKPASYSLSSAIQLEQLAGQVAVALENLRLVQAQQTSLREMEVLTRQLSGQAWAKRRQRQAGEAVQYARSGIDADLPASTPEIEAAIAQHAPLARSEPDSSDNRSPYQAALAVPIVLRGEVLGGLQVGEAHQPREWTEDDLTFMQAVADQVALALDNARLIEETQQRAERERLVADISSRMFAANDLETIVQIASEELSRVLQVRQTTVKVRSESAEAFLQPGNGQTPDQHA